MKTDGAPGVHRHGTIPLPTRGISFCSLREAIHQADGDVASHSPSLLLEARKKSSEMKKRDGRRRSTAGLFGVFAPCISTMVRPVCSSEIISNSEADTSVPVDSGQLIEALMTC